MIDRKPGRCAIYTRKSTEHNLDLEFNSLDAQREACEAYIKSQTHEGWRLVPTRYDDGGLSGASLERPDLQRLLADIGAGLVDTVVVYKVDRLTRSLTDFAKLVELFDKHGVSFVSITQSFNTTTSMGRLTLNVLLSFAQFEREVIGERVRDKIAASKRKGLWMGGSVPFGYANLDKKLVIVPDEAETVRWIFQRYLELGAIGPLLEDLNRRGVTTRARLLRDGRIVGGGRFGKGGLNHFLKNRAYIGEIAHHGEIHPAAHEPILERQLFDAVQAKMRLNNVIKTSKLKSSPFLLAGLIFDSAGNRMTPSHSQKKGVRYRYYISQALIQRRKAEAGDIARIAAPDIENLVLQALIGRLGIRASYANEQEARALLDENVGKIIARSDVIEILPLERENGAGGAQRDSIGRPSLSEPLNVPSQAKSFIAPKGVTHSPSQDDPPSTGAARDELLEAIAKARLWVSDLARGKVDSFAEIAKREGKGERQIRLLAPLAFLPPPAVRSIIKGTAPRYTVTYLAKNVTWVWQAYRQGTTGPDFG